MNTSTTYSQLVTEHIFEKRLIPVLTINDLSHVAPLAEALIESGIKNVEVTLRTSVSLKALAAFALYEGLITGVGSVKSVEDLKSAIDVGAQFAVSPGFQEEIGEFAKEKEVLYLPGVATATEIMVALSCGFNLLKFFPAEQLGGLKMLNALSPVFPSVRFIPTGGINAANAKDYLLHKSVAAVGGSWMFNSSLLENQNFKELRESMADALALTRGI
jgi:2-dehydro-3-deoxyphosphogluconate aldolase/(4S)-4-hydroxy-2-oxoglutarate aldolase